MVKIEYHFVNGTVKVNTLKAAKKLKKKTKIDYEVKYIPVEPDEPAAGWKDIKPTI